MSNPPAILPHTHPDVAILTQLHPDISPLVRLPQHAEEAGLGMLQLAYQMCKKDPGIGTAEVQERPRYRPVVEEGIGLQ